MLQQYQQRYNEVLADFHRLRDDIPPAFKRAFAAHELQRRGFNTGERPQNLLADIGERPQNEIGENSELTLKAILRESGKDDEYIKTDLTKIASKLSTAGFDFMNDDLVEEFVKGGRGSKKTKVKFTPKGYLGAIIKLSSRLLGKDFKNKYENFLLNSATFTAKLDMIYTEQMRALMNRIGELSLQNQQIRRQVTTARRALTNTTNQTDQSFWGHLKNMCEAGGKVAPRFEPVWNQNARIIHGLRVELSGAGEVYRLDETGPWLYRDAAIKDIVIARFPQLMLI